LERKSETNSPIKSSRITKKLTESIKPHSFKNQENEYESFLFEKNTSRKESAISLRNFEKQSFFKQPEKLKINLQDLPKDLKVNDALREVKNSAKIQKTLRKNQDPLTSREIERVAIKPQFRKTKSLEKLRNQKTQNSKQYSKFYFLKDSEAVHQSNTSSFGIIDHTKRITKSASKDKSSDEIKTPNNEQQNNLEKILKDGNERLLKENKKLERMTISIQLLKDKYENEYEKQSEKNRIIFREMP